MMSLEEKEFRDKASVLRDLLYRERRAQAGMILKSGFLAFIGLGSISLLLFGMIHALISPQVLGLRIALAVLEIGFLAFVLARFLVLPLMRLPNLDALAKQVEKERSLEDLLVAAVDLSSRDTPRGVSQELLLEIVRRAYDLARSLRVHTLFFPARRTRAFVALSMAGLGAILLWSWISPASLLDALEAAVHPAAGVVGPSSANLHAGPGDVTVLAGEDVAVYAVDFGGGPGSIDLRYNQAGNLWKRTALTPSTFDGGLPRYQYTFEGVEHSFDYYFEQDGRKTRSHTVSVVHPPVVNDLRLTLEYPSYTGLAPKAQESNQGNVAALVGTRIVFRGESNRPLKKATLELDDDEDVELTIDGPNFRGELLLRRNGAYQIALLDSAGNTNSASVRYTLECLPDNPPQVVIEHPGRDVPLSRSLSTELFLSVSDDYGIDRVDLVYSIESEGDEWGRTRIPVEPPQDGDAWRRELEREYPWDLSGIDLFPGDVVVYFLEARDNNHLTGPGIGKSAVYRLRVPTMSEIYADIEDEDAGRAKVLNEILAEGEELSKRFEKISRELKKNPDADWTRKREMEKALEKQEELREKVEEVQESLEETLEELSENQATSQEIGEKMEQIQQLLEDINREELRDYLENVRQSLEDLSPEELERAMEQAKLSMEQLMKSLDRTINLLERMRQEQKMEEIVRRTEAALESQEELTRETREMSDREETGEDVSEEERQELADRQRELSEEIEKLREEMEKFSQDVQENYQEVSEQMSDATEQLCENQVSQKMEQAAEDIEASDEEQAQENQEQAAEALSALFYDVQQCQGSMQMMSQQRVVQGLEDAARDLLDISLRQEGLGNEFAGEHKVSSSRALAEEQQTLFRATSQVVEHLNQLAQETFFITMEMSVQMGRALRNMQLSAHGLAEGRLRDASMGSKEAVAALNRTVIELLRQSVSASSAGSGLGFAQMMQRMGQMSEEQMALNQMTQEMMGGQEGQQEGLSMEERAQMARIAGRQRGLQQMLNELMKEGGQTDRLLGDLDRVAHDMEEVIRDLVSEEADEETLRRQERILSRLLDAQKSVHRRDYEKKRESRTAEDVYSGDVADDALSEERLKRLRQDIDRALQSRLPAEYERLIREYFRALSQEAQEVIDRESSEESREATGSSGR